MEFFFSPVFMRMGVDTKVAFGLARENVGIGIGVVETMFIFSAHDGLSLSCSLFFFLFWPCKQQH